MPETAPAPAASPAPPASAPPASAPPAKGGGSLPSIDELSAAWDSVLQALPQKVKVRYSTLRFTEVTPTHAVLALPSEGYRKRCEDVRADVERALADRFGVAIPLRLVADSGAGGAAVAARPSDDPPPPEPEPVPEEHIDLEELTDAPAGGGVLEQLTSAFPGAELLDEQ